MCNKCAMTFFFLHLLHLPHLIFACSLRISRSPLLSASVVWNCRSFLQCCFGRVVASTSPLSKGRRAPKAHYLGPWALACDGRRWPGRASGAGVPTSVGWHVLTSRVTHMSLTGLDFTTSVTCRLGPGSQFLISTKNWAKFQR
jgi:hypothetical protein